MSNPEFLGHALRHTLPLTRGQTIAIFDALLASGFRYVGPDEVVVKKQTLDNLEANWPASEKEKK